MKRTSPKEPDIDDSPVQWIIMPGSVKRIYNFRTAPDDIMMVMQMSAEMTKKLGLKGPKLIAAKTVGSLEDGMQLLYSENDVYNIGRVIHDKFTRVFAIAKDNYDFVFPSDVQMIGEPVGYCAAEDINSDLLRFRKIRTVK